MGQSTAKSFVMKFIERLGVKLIGLVIGVLLMRLLDAETFGVLAIITVFINLAQVFVQSGLNTALIQKKEINDEDYFTVFTVSVIMSLVLCALLWVFSPVLAEYYKMPELKETLRVFSITLIVGAFNSVQIAKLSREMRFDRIMVASIVASITSGGIGVVLAYLGWGIWTLVAYSFLQQVIVTLVIFITDKWTPRFFISRDSFKATFSFGWKILLSKMMYSIYTELRVLIIGKIYSAADLAYYDKGNQYPNIISYNFDQAIGSVMLSRISKEQNDVSMVKQYMRKGLTMSTYIIMPIMVGLAIAAEEFVCVLLTNKWIQAYPYIVILSLGYIFLPISSINCTTIMAIGRTDILVKTQVVRIGTMLLLLIASVLCFSNPLYIAVGYSVGMLFEAIINIWPVKKIVGYGYFEQLKDICPTLFITVAMGVVVKLVGLFPLEGIVLLAVRGMVGLLVFIVLSGLTRNETYLYITDYIKRTIVTIRQK